MALTVEDGTGILGAEAYASVATADTYWSNRTQNALYTAWNAAVTAVKEGALREAADFLDATYGPYYRGKRAGDVQGLAWPRVDAVGRDGGVVPALPLCLVRASMELAARAVTAPVAPDQARGGLVKSAKAGPASVEFMEGATAKTTYGVINEMLWPILSGGPGKASWNWR